MPTEKPHISVVVPDEMLKDIEDYRFIHRFPNRSAAIVSLIKMGFAWLRDEELRKEQDDSRCGHTLQTK